MGMMPAAFEYMGMPISTASGTLHQAPAPMMDAMKFCGHVAVDDGADGDAGEHVGPDLADDVLDRLPGVAHAGLPGESLARDAAASPILISRTQSWM